VQDIKKLLDAKAVAEVAGLPVSSIYDLARRNIIPNIRVGKAVRFHPDKFKEWLEHGGSKDKQPSNARVTLEYKENSFHSP
jgi:excisionase family DNA binding protein